MNIWDKFDKEIDVVGLSKDVEAASANNVSYKEVPHGQYEVKIGKLELVESKSGNPMLSCWFKVVAGEYSGSTIFMNQVITQGFQIHIANEFLRSLDSGYDIEFKKYSQYNSLILDVHEAIYGKREYVLDYSEGKKGFNNYEIVEVYEV